MYTCHLVSDSLKNDVNSVYLLVSDSLKNDVNSVCLLVGDSLKKRCKQCMPA